MKPPQLKNTHLPLKSEASFQKMIPRKKPKKSETIINASVSIITNQWKKIAEIPQEYDFVTWGVKTFELKVKQFVREYYIT